MEIATAALTHLAGFPTLPAVSNIVTLDQLRQAIQIKEQIAALEATLVAILGGKTVDSIPEAVIPRRRGRPPGKRSANGAAVVAPAGSNVAAPGKPGRGGRRVMSPEAKAKIAAAQKKRWAKFHAAQGK